MSIRSRSLPYGWYPDNDRETRNRIEKYLRSSSIAEYQASAGIVPHAGWDFSGQVALEVIANLDKEVETVVVVGGHLYREDTMTAAFESRYETPLGEIIADVELLEAIRKEIQVREDTHPDNTVEVQLPFLKYMFPKARVLGLRAAPSDQSILLGRVLFRVSQAISRKTLVVGSTDLTHYGANYGFAPKGSGKSALDWVRNVNDKRFIDSIIHYRLEDTLELARREKSACSAGGAVAAASFAKEKGEKDGILLRYLNSCDIYPAESFVGYAGIVYP